MTLAQRAISRIVHNEVRDTILYPEVQHAHDMRMHDAGNATRLVEELLHIAPLQAHLQQFDCGPGSEMNMLAKIDVGEAPLPHHLNKAIVAKLLSYVINHFLFLTSG